MRWLGWLVGQGLPPAEADAQSLEPGLPYERVVDRSLAAQALCRSLTRVEALAIHGGLSSALAAALDASLGERALDFLCASAERAPIDLRVNLLRTTVKRARAILEGEGIHVEPTPLSKIGLRVRGRANIVGSRAYRDGLIEIQDEGSQLVAQAVRPEAGLVVDLCAGAGGKTLALAAQAPEASLLAADVRGGALGQLERRARRAGVRQLRTLRLAADGGWPSEIVSPVGRASRVLVDAPCTGTGTLRRHPEHRLRLDGPAIAAMPALQASILQRAAPLVAPGGRLVYATCSVLDLENHQVVDDFLSAHQEFTPTPALDLPAALRPLCDERGRLELRPEIHGTDGFFVASLTRAREG